MGNVPVVYMTAIAGWGDKTWGVRGLVGSDAVLGLVAAGVMLAWFLTKGRKTASSFLAFSF